jgi:hypothetical protein
MKLLNHELLALLLFTRKDLLCLHSTSPPGPLSLSHTHTEMATATTTKTAAVAIVHPASAAVKEGVEHATAPSTSSTSSSSSTAAAEQLAAWSAAALKRLRTGRALPSRVQHLLQRLRSWLWWAVEELLEVSRVAV